jgi:hypothetical protein
VNTTIDDALNAASPRWVRLSRSVFCLAAAAVLCWRGVSYDDPHHSTAIPFAMCQLTAFTITAIALLNLGDRHAGPS